MSAAHCAGEAGHAAVFDALADSGVEVATMVRANGRGYTPLHYAAERGYVHPRVRFAYFMVEVFKPFKCRNGKGHTVIIFLLGYFYLGKIVEGNVFDAVVIAFFGNGKPFVVVFFSLVKLVKAFVSNADIVVAYRCLPLCSLGTP